jgi:MarR family transcriptional regulator for hemolysin
MTLPTYFSGTLYMKAARALRTAVYNCLSKYELTATSWSLLGIVYNARDGIRLAEVGQTIGVKAPLITMMANTLMERGYINRLPHHSDGRAKLLVITPEGKRFVNKVEDELNHNLRFLLNGATPEDLDSYQRVLETIIDNDSKKR